MSLSRAQLFGTPWTVVYKIPLSMEFSRQEYWNWLPFPSPGIFPTQGSNPGLPHCGQTLYRLSHQGSPIYKTSKAVYTPYNSKGTIFSHFLFTQVKNMENGACFLSVNFFRRCKTRPLQTPPPLCPDFSWIIFGYFFLFFFWSIPHNFLPFPLSLSSLTLIYCSLSVCFS